MIDKYYKTLTILRYQKGGFGTASGYQNAGTFKGLIQAPANSNTFNNGKDTSTVAGTLFCSPSVHFEPKDIVEDNGNKYIIAGQGTQPTGISGIIPKKGLHCEYTLLWAEDNV